MSEHQGFFDRLLTASEKSKRLEKLFEKTKHLACPSGRRQLEENLREEAARKQNKRS